MDMGLNALALGEARESHLGVSVQRLKYLAIVVVSAAIGASVAVSSSIGFVGIAVLHLLRLAISPENCYLLPERELARVDLEGFAGRFYQELSGGEQ